MERIFVCLLLPAVFLGASSFLEAQDAVNVESLAQKATLIGVATVQSEMVRRNPDNNMIYTDYALKFSEVWKGEPTDPFLLTKAGGQLDNKVVATPGHDFRLKVGDEIVTFTHPSDLGNHVAIGMHQGIFQVGPGPQKIVHRLLEPRSEARSPMSLAALKERVFRSLGKSVEVTRAPGAGPAPSAGPPGGGPLVAPEAPRAPGPGGAPDSGPPSNRGSAALMLAGIVMIAAVLFILWRRKSRLA
jgi:hypothetical protein